MGAHAPARRAGRAGRLISPGRLSLVGRADCHLLPRILATTIGRHRLKRPRSANPRNSSWVDGRRCRLGQYNVQRGHGAVSKIPFSREKIVSLRFLRPEILRISAKTGEGGRKAENPGELERAAALSNFQSCPAACTVGTGRFLRRKIPFSREKNASLQAPRPKNLRFLAETGEGGSGGGACFPATIFIPASFRAECCPARLPSRHAR